MKIRFYIDPETEQPHIYNHGIREDEVEYVLRKPGEDRPGRDGSRVAIGKTSAGRYLRVKEYRSRRRRKLDGFVKRPHNLSFRAKREIFPV